MEVTPALVFKVFVGATAAAGLLDMLIVQQLKRIAPTKFRAPAYGERNLGWARALAPVRRLLGEPTLSYMRIRTLFFPWFELAVGGLTVAGLQIHGPGIGLAGSVLSFGFLLSLAVIGWQTSSWGSIVPDSISIPGILTGLAVSILPGGVSFLQSLAGAALGAAIVLTVYYSWFWLRREEGIGLGIVKELAMVGAFLGVGGMLLSFFLAVLSGSVFGLFLNWRGRISLTDRLPVSPFLAFGGVVAGLWSEPIVSWYLSLR